MKEAGISKFTFFQAKEILRVLNQIIKTSKSELKTSLCQGMALLVNRKIPKFTCGLFDFNFKLILRIMGALATNLIILIQFDSASRNTT